MGRKTAAALLLIVLIGCAINMMPYLMHGKIFSDGDQSLFSMISRDISREQKIDYSNKESFLGENKYPPGFMLLLAILKGFTLLDFQVILIVLHFISLVFLVFTVFILTSLFFNDDKISLLACFFAVTMRSPMNPDILGPLFFLPSFLGLTLIPLALFLLFKGLFVKRKNLLLFVFILSLIASLHGRAPAYLGAVLLCYAIFMLLFGAEYLKKSATIILCLISSIIISSMWWFNVISLNILYELPIETLRRLIYERTIIFFTGIAIVISFIFLFYHFIIKKELTIKLDKRDLRVLHILAYLMIFAYLGWFLYKLNALDDLSTLLDNHLMLSVGFIPYLAAPLGIIYLLEQKHTRKELKLMWGLWFFFLLFHSLGWLSFFESPYRSILFLTTPLSVIAGCGVVRLISRKVIIRNALLIIILVLAVYPSILFAKEYSAKLRNFDELLAAASWINLNLDSSKKMISEGLFSNDINIFTNIKAVGGAERGRWLSDNTLRVIRSLVSKNPYTMIRVMNDFDADYLAFNKYKAERSLKYWWGWTSFEEFEEFIKKKYGEKTDLEKYDRLENLNKIYNDGETIAYSLNSKKIPKQSLDLSSEVINNNFSFKYLSNLSNEIYLGNIITLEIEMTYYNEEDEDVSFLYSFVDSFDQEIKGEQVIFELKPFAPIKRNFTIEIPKYMWEGNYTITAKFTSKNKTASEKKSLINLKEPAVFIYDVEPSCHRDCKGLINIGVLAKNQDNFAIDSSVVIELSRNNNIFETFAKEARLPQNSFTDIQFEWIPQETGYYDINAYIKTEMGIIPYKKIDFINVTSV
jgi:hypothetical protein